MRTCPFTGCKATIPDHLFACGRHWHSLNPRQQRHIYAAYDDYLADKIGFDALRRRQQQVLDEAQGRTADA